MPGAPKPTRPSCRRSRPAACPGCPSTRCIGWRWTIAARYGLVGLTTAEVAWINRLWHQLTPWPDAVPGLTRLRQGYPVCALSNGNVSLLLDMAAMQGCPGTCSLARSLPALQAGRGGLPGCLHPARPGPEQVMLCAAHNGDLQAAKELGLATAFIQRPREKGPPVAKSPQAAGIWKRATSRISRPARPASDGGRAGRARRLSAAQALLYPAGYFSPGHRHGVSRQAAQET